MMSSDNLSNNLVNKKIIILPGCDKPYHTNKWEVQKEEGVDVLRNYA